MLLCMVYNKYSTIKLGHVNQLINQSIFINVVSTLSLRARLQVRHKIKIQNRKIKTSWKCIKNV